MLVLVFLGNRISPVLRVCTSFVLAFVICCVLPLTTQYLEERTGYYTDLGIIIAYGTMLSAFIGA